MARHQRFTPIGEYQPFHISATGTLAPVGKCVSTTAPTTITAGSGVVVTPASMASITPGMLLNFANGTGTAEDVTVIYTASTTFTANFINNHSGAYTIISRRGIDIGNVVIGNAGTGCTLTLYNGHPSMLPDAGSVMAVIDPSQPVSREFQCTCDKGLFYTYAGTPGDITLMYLDHATAL